MPIDPSIPLRAGQGVVQPANYLAMASQAQGLANANLNNRLAQQQRASEVAAGRDFQGAIGPNGQLDQGKLNLSLANDPQAAMSAASMSQSGLQNLNAQLQAKGLTLDQAMTRIKYASNQLGSLLANPQQITRKSLINTIAGGVGDGVYTAKDAAGLISSIPEDPAAAQQWAKAHYASAQQSIEALKPHIMVGDNGQTQFAVNTNPTAGPVGVMGALYNNRLTPAQSASPVQITGPQGQPVTLPLGAYARNPGVVQGPTPGQVRQQTTNAEYDANLGNSWTTQATNVQSARAALSGIGTFSEGAAPGVLNESLATISNAMQNLGLKGAGALATNSNITQKETAQLLMQQANSLGVPTDGKMSLASLGTPNLHMTPDAINATKGLLMGQFDYVQARSQAWNAARNSMSATDFQTQFNKNVPNADVFQFEHLPEPARAKFWQSLSKNERQQFAKSYAWLQKAGLLEAPQ